MYSCFKEIKEKIANKSVDCVTIVKKYLERVESFKSLNSFIDLYSDEAISIAESIDSKIRRGDEGKLAGMVIGIKDTICYKDHRIRAGSKIFRKFCISIFSNSC